MSYISRTSELGNTLSCPTEFMKTDIRYRSVEQTGASRTRQTWMTKTRGFKLDFKKIKTFAL